MPVRTAAAIALLLFLSGCTMWGEKKVPAWSSATGPETFERLLWQDIEAGRWFEVEKHLSPTFTATLPSGTYNKEATLALWKRQQGRALSLGEFAVQPEGNSFVVTYLAHSAGMPPLRMMTIWQRAGEKQDQWMAIAHAEVPVSAENSAGTKPPKM